MQTALSVIFLTAVTAFVAFPMLRGVDEPAVDALREELEIAKQAKYREIRDAELDRRVGKLSEEEWRRTDRELRREAAFILAGMDSGRRPPDASTTPSRRSGEPAPDGPVKDPLN